ncbi:uncharacterized protein LOC132730980 isoform X4 [Ruditapes philippinarum]|uniref:uncharacterized protein LOC132730980 isoform X4 n=1 Tax=Ruditapes philippinarum TaxID=129788 RepID=UPI00295B0251|nr:uncharacterized protein LOC132730980 isoform X4 [Ruditapes philippinarum]
MESYLMMLYVTLEQESALKNFFVDQGWRFCKPDLSVTTDKVGPSVTTPPVVPLKDKAAADDTVADQNKQSSRIVVKEPESTPKTDSPLTRNKGKRKTESPQATSTNVKQPKVLLPQSTVTVPKSSESVSSKTEVVDKPLSSSSNLTPITVLGEDGKHFTIKIEQDADDLQENVVQAESRHDGICANSSDNVMCNDNNSFYDGGDDNFHDDGDDVNDESTDMDYSNDGALGNTSVNTENQLSAGDSMGSASLKGSTKSKGKRKKSKAKILKTVVNNGNDQLTDNQDQPEDECLPTQDDLLVQKTPTPLAPRMADADDSDAPCSGLALMMANDGNPTNANQAKPGPDTVFSIMENLKHILGAVDTACSTLQVTNKRLNKLVVNVNTLESKVDNLTLMVRQRNNESIVMNESYEVDPPTNSLPEELIRQLKREARSPGHFAALLLPHVLPELFDTTNKRFLYNLNGTSGKEKICPEKREIIKQHVNYYYPETKNPVLWNAVVLSINERLRRVPKNRGK